MPPGRLLDTRGGAPVGPGGTTSLTIAGIVCYFDPLGGETYVPLTPYRAFDTRTSSPVPARATVSEPAVNGGVDFFVLEFVMNVTVTDTTSPGYLTAFQPGTTMPGTSNLNWAAGQTVPNMTIPFGGDPTAVDYYNGSSSPIDILGDVLGYFG